MLLSLEEILQRYGEHTARWQFLWQRLQTIVQLLTATGALRRLYLFGSFITAKPNPGDLDCLAVMASGFTTAHLAPSIMTVFQHDICRLYYQADVFWITEAVGQEYLETLLAVFARDRSGNPQPLVEVVL